MLICSDSMKGRQTRTDRRHARRPGVLLAGVAFLLAGLSASGCVSLGSLAEKADPRDWLGKDKRTEEEAVDEARETDRAGHPRNMAVGIVHMVNDEGRFVLVRSFFRDLQLPRDAELYAYDNQGTPTGKLKLSPERKGLFLVADIEQGGPLRGDTVILHAASDGQGGLVRPGSQPGQVQVLE